MRTCVLRDERQRAVCLGRDFAPDELAFTFSCTAIIDAASSARLVDVRTIDVSKDAYYSVVIRWLQPSEVDGTIRISGSLVVRGDNIAPTLQDCHARARCDGCRDEGRARSTPDATRDATSEAEGRRESARLDEPPDPASKG